VVVVNNAFYKATGLDAGLLVGQKISQIPWKLPDNSDIPPNLPWIEAARTGMTQRGTALMLHSKATGPRIFAVSASPISGDGTTSRGTLVSLDDITTLHHRNSELVTMVKDLKQAQEIVRQQNAQLSVMAMKDALTGCYNRRALFDRLSAVWADSKRYKHPASIVMVDVDYFKSVNDKHGHAVGDQVLQRIAQVLNSTAREGDVIARYGGEEFCLLLPHTDVDQAERAAERLRQAIEKLQIGAISVTASFGVTEIAAIDANVEALMERADNALYAAKRTGRNRVLRADQMPGGLPPQQVKADKIEAIASDSDAAIPFPAVTALMTALQHRDLGTAAHCRRVADMCVLIATGLLQTRDVLVLEVAALLHDIGKIGVPDAILLKPGPLTAEEFEVMDRHSYIGIEIIQAAFRSHELTYIVRTHHAFYDSNPRLTDLPRGEAIPLRARILSIVDAYDAMVSDRVYRKARSQREAFDELRRCAGSQFDPVLVERFIEVILARDEHRPVDALSPTQERWAQLSVEVERLASAVDARDMESLSAVAHRLGQAAAKMEIPVIADLAMRLHSASNVEHDLGKVLESVNEMLSLCHSAQADILGSVSKDFPESALVVADFQSGR
jgi:diguanylate cyclase (GGDEF)-like protein/putative nucleotidyltransferase with HDIG domain